LAAIATITITENVQEPTTTPSIGLLLVAAVVVLPEKGKTNYFCTT
jgi:hypothetical protein